MGRRFLAFGLLVLVGCEQNVVGVVDLEPPTGLTYQLEPSGTPGRPAGVILRWNPTSDPQVDAWNVYGRSGGASSWYLRGTTTSNSFHDRGQPELDYHVVAVTAGGAEGPASAIVTIDERLALARPTSLTSVSLDGAVVLLWSDESYRSDPDGFWHYRVYSAAYDVGANRCDTGWMLEGTTVAAEFRVGSLVNGLPRCFAVSGIAIEGYESLWSPLRSDTPRPEARNVALTARQVTDASAGFRFWRDQDGDGAVQRGELGRVGAGSAPDVDFSVERDPSGRLFLSPVRTGTTLAPFGTAAIGDLTEIDRAPASGYARTALEARPGWGYVFQIGTGSAARFGSLRVSHVGRDLLIFDWAFQTNPGNPELVVGH